MAEPENMTLILLREMRAEIATVREEMRSNHAQVIKRLDAMHQNGMKALKGFIGHRSMVERTVASFDDQVTRLEQRVGALEDARPTGA